MQWIKWMRRIGRVSFLLFWIPFTVVWFLDDPRSASGELTLASLPTAHLLVIGSGAILLTSALGFLLLSTFLAVVVRPLALRGGVRAQARVLSVENTDTEINEQPLVRLKLEVYPQDQAPFQAEAEEIVPLVMIPQLQPGAMVAVKYNPRTQQVTLDR